VLVVVVVVVLVVAPVVVAAVVVVTSPSSGGGAVGPVTDSSLQPAATTITSAVIMAIRRCGMYESIRHEWFEWEVAADQRALGCGFDKEFRARKICRWERLPLEMYSEIAKREKIEVRALVPSSPVGNNRTIPRTTNGVRFMRRLGRRW
jgi:hypothetical protein